MYESQVVVVVVVAGVVVGVVVVIGVVVVVVVVVVVGGGVGLLYTYDAADEEASVDLGGRRIITNNYSMRF